LYENTQRDFQQLRQAVAQYAQSELAKQNQPVTPKTPDFDPDDVVTNPQGFVQHLQGMTQQQIQQALNQMGAPVVQSLTALARNAVSQDTKYRQVFERWENEIEQEAARYPNANKHDVRFWQQIAKNVKSEHVDELAQELATKKIANMPKVETGQTSTGEFLSKAETSTMEKIKDTAWGKEFFGSHEGAARKVTDMCSKTGRTLEQFYESVKNSPKRNYTSKSKDHWVTQIVD